MRILTIIFSSLLLCSCSNTKTDHIGEKYIIETTVQLKEGSMNKVLELFKSTNPGLVKNEKDWIRASVASIEKSNTIIVRAEWRNKESYIRFSQSAEFKETMGLFGEFFQARPQVIISKVLHEM